MKPGALVPVAAKGELGDRRPSLATRVRPGQSGNPRGQPKTASRLRALVAKEFAEEVEARENSQPARITKLEAAVKQFVNRAANGDQRAAQFVFSLLADEPDRATRAQSLERIWSWSRSCGASGVGRIDPLARPDLGLRPAGADKAFYCLQVC